MEITKKSVRDTKWQRSSQEVEKELNEKLEYLKSFGYSLETKIETNGPPVGNPVGLKLVADDVSLLPQLVEISKVFEGELRSYEGIKNISNSSPDSPGQVIFNVDTTKASELDLNPIAIYQELASLSNGARAGSIRTEDEDIDIRVYYEKFRDSVSPSDLLNSRIQTPSGNSIILDQVVDYTITNAVQNIAREDGDIIISVGADLQEGFIAGPLQGKFQEFAKNYSFPTGIRFKAAWENAENQELLVATAVSFVVALLMIFVILVLLFNSFAQPFIILYSVILALVGINIGLFVMNIFHDIGLFFASVPYSLPFGIGFIALTGIVVNDAIILIDKINRNRAIGMSGLTTVTEAGKSRLQPIILTTLTTVFGLLPLALQDEFWAGLALTVIFGLFAGSAMTLFVIPAIYYELFIAKKSLFRYIIMGQYITGPIKKILRR